MSLRGCMYPQGPILGDWPPARLEAQRHLGPGDYIVIDNGLVRKAKTWGEVGVRIPDGAEIDGNLLKVPEWWWWMHFRELLKVAGPEQCCGEGGVSREYCDDCPRNYPDDAFQSESQPTFDFAPRSVVPCFRGVRCNWPACAQDCDGRPGR